MKRSKPTAATKVQAGSILISPPGHISVADKARLEKMGIVCVEAAEPERCVIRNRPSSTALAETNDLLMSAMEALCRYETSSADRTIFVRELLRRMQLKEQAQKNQKR